MPAQQSRNLAIAALQLKTEITYKNIKELLAPHGIDVLVLKGPHLGTIVYDSPKERLYGDLDLLVKPSSFQTVVATLMANNYSPHAYDQFSREIQEDFKHWEFNSPWGVLVEVHRWLSSHERYPLDSEGLFARAEKFVFGETSALGLSTEDLLFHLCLHMGTSYFQVIERKHIKDIELLVKKRKIDWPIFMKRVKKVGAGTVAFYALSSARLQRNANIPDLIITKLRPGFLRRWWIEKFIDASHFPVYRFPSQSINLAKKRLIFPLMDRPCQWARFGVRIIKNKLKAIV